MTSPRLLVSCYPYALIKGARVLGKLSPEDGAEAETTLIKAEEAKRDDSDWPCYRTLAQVERVEACTLVSDASGGLPQCRSRMAGRFLASEADVWLQVDDDLFAEIPVIEQTLSLCRLNRCIVTAPYLLRDGVTQSVTPFQVDGTWRARTTGMGLVAIHREALQRIAPHAPPFVAYGERHRGFYYELIDEWCGWMGEDFSFCARAHAAQVPMVVLTEAPTCHAGRWSYMNPDGSFTVHRATPLGAAQAAQ